MPNATFFLIGVIVALVFSLALPAGWFVAVLAGIFAFCLLKLLLMGEPR